MCFYISHLTLYRLVRHTNSLSNWGVDVVFVHGLWGGVFFTWRQREKDGFDSGASDISNFSFCWPRDWLLEDVQSRKLEVSSKWQLFSSEMAIFVTLTQKVILK